MTSGHLARDTRIFHKQAKSLTKAGYDVILIVRHEKNEVMDGVKVTALPKARNRLWSMLGTWRMFKLAYRQKCDVYHFHDPQLLPVGLLLKLLTKGKVIYDTHEDYPKIILTMRWLPPIARRLVSYVFSFLEKSVSARLDYVVAATDSIAKEFKTGKVATIKNYPVLERIQPKCKYNSEPTTLIYAGLLTESKGISELVQAMKYLDYSRNIKLTLCGEFSPESYEEKVRRLEGFEKVEYLGWLKPEEVWLQMTQATVGIVCLHPIPTYVVAMPVKLFEYMAAGLPVIASNFPLWKEIVEVNNCGLTVNPLNPIEIAKAIEYLVEHPDEAKMMGVNSRKAIVEKYNWENESRKLIALYARLVPSTCPSGNVC